MTTLKLISNRLLVMALGTLVLCASATAADRDRDDRDRDRDGGAETANARSIGGCSDPLASADLDINNVRARVYNNGALFWNGGNPLYEVPKGSGQNAIFASGLWLGGEVGGNLRFAGADYSDWEFWPGPLGPNGESPSATTCTQFDRFWKVNRSQVLEYYNDGTVAPDLGGWPIAQGAPYYVDLNQNGKRDVSTDDDDGNGDGVTNEPRLELNVGDPGYSSTLGGGASLDLANNEMPDIIGDQGIWWVMNDKGNQHLWSNAEQIGIEVRALAFAFQTADALNNTTFYRYQLFYRGAVPLENAYIGLWSDPDLGDAADDYVGSIPDIGVGYVYNGDDFDGGTGGYLDQPPALGYDFFQGPLVNNDGLDNDGDGEIDEDDERLGMERFVFYNNDGSPQGNPADGVEAFQYLRGFWRDNVAIEFGGNGRDGTTGEEAPWMFPGIATPTRGGGLPPSYWSEYNIDGAGGSVSPSDRRFVQSSGPFVIQPGDSQEIVFGMVWSQAPPGCGATPQIASVAQLRFDDITAQGAFNADFDVPSPPPAVVVDATPLDQEVILEWNSATGNDLDITAYEVVSPFADPAAADQTYNFEGYKIFQFRDEADQTGTLISTLDVTNNVTVVTDVGLDCESGATVTEVTAQGDDGGVRNYLSIQIDVFTQQPLRNNTSYYFGVQPYAYNEASSPQKVFSAPITRLEVRPSLLDPRNDGTFVNSSSGMELPLVVNAIGDGVVNATVTNPTAITGDTYQVEFYSAVCGQDEKGEDVPCLTYRVLNMTSGATLFDGAEFFAQTGELPPLGLDVFRTDGITFDIAGPTAGPLFLSNGSEAFVEVVGPGGADPCGPDAGSTFGCDEVGGNFIYPSFNGTGDYLMHFLAAGPEAQLAAYAPNDYEIRWTDEGSYAATIFSSNEVMKVPYEVWDIGVVAPGAENDPSDDVQMIPAHFDDGNGDNPSSCVFNFGETTDLGFPATDRIYAYYPVDGMSHDDWVAYAQPLVDGNGGCAPAPSGDQTNYFSIADGVRGRPIQRVIFLDNTGTGDVGIMQGSVQRFYSTNPIQAGDSYTINTGDFLAVRGDQQTADAALDLMAITPNPYRARSEYERNNLQNIARFVNLPAQATIRIFTLSGTLVRTLTKVNPAVTTLDWDLNTEANLPVASGMYLIHIEARNENGGVIGERVLKFGVVQRRIQLDTL